MFKSLILLKIQFQKVYERSLKRQKIALNIVHLQNKLYTITVKLLNICYLLLIYDIQWWSFYPPAEWFVTLRNINNCGWPFIKHKILTVVFEHTYDSSRKTCSENQRRMIQLITKNQTALTQYTSTLPSQSCRIQGQLCHKTLLQTCFGISAPQTATCTCIGFVCWVLMALHVFHLAHNDRQWLTWSEVNGMKSEVTTLWRCRNVCITIIIIFLLLLLIFRPTSTKPQAWKFKKILFILLLNRSKLYCAYNTSTSVGNVHFHQKVKYILD